MRISFSFFYLHEDINEASCRFAGYQLEEEQAAGPSRRMMLGAGAFDGKGSAG